MDSSSSRSDRILELARDIARLSFRRGQLLARLRPISNELANKRRELDKLVKEINDG